VQRSQATHLRQPGLKQPRALARRLQYCNSMNTRTTTACLAMLALLGTACSPDASEKCASRDPAFRSGIAGCATSHNDIGDPPPEGELLPDFPIDVFTTQPSHDPEDGAKPDFHAETDAIGYYEIALDAGHYVICTSFRRCTELDLDGKNVHRLDYDFSVGPGWSE
jgi:hypothetical protein